MNDTQDGGAMINLKNWFSSPCFDRTLKLGRLEVQARMRRNDGFMGRFGGGWNWELGFQIGGRCLLINLLVMSVRFVYTEEK